MTKIISEFILDALKLNEKELKAQTKKLKPINHVGNVVQKTYDGETIWLSNNYYTLKIEVPYNYIECSNNEAYILSAGKIIALEPPKRIPKEEFSLIRSPNLAVRFFGEEENSDKSPIDLKQRQIFSFSELAYYLAREIEFCANLSLFMPLFDLFFDLPTPDRFVVYGYDQRIKVVLELKNTYKISLAAMGLDIG